MVLMWIRTSCISATINMVLPLLDGVMQTFGESSFMYKGGKSNSFQCKK